MADDLTLLAGEATRDEIAQAILYANADAKRMLARDNLNRPNPRWAKQHQYINHLLTMWQAAA